MRSAVERLPAEGVAARRFELFVPLRERIFSAALARALADCRSILDLGCGSDSPVARAGFRGFAVGADIATPQLSAARRLHFHDGLVRADVSRVGEIFAAGCFDAVVALDVLEHLEREAAESMLVQLERIARRRVVILTPNGFVPQPGTPENPFQEHRSGFSVDDLRARGFDVRGMHGFRPLFGPYGEVHLRPRALWRRVADVSALLVYRRPEAAFSLLATKELHGGGA